MKLFSSDNYCIIEPVIYHTIAIGRIHFLYTVFPLISAPYAYLNLKLSGAVLKTGAYFKIRGIIHMEFQNIVIFIFQITNNYCYNI